jgi:hypothetical protein
MILPPYYQGQLLETSFDYTINTTKTIVKERLPNHIWHEAGAR